MNLPFKLRARSWKYSRGYTKLRRGYPALFQNPPHVRALLKTRKCAPSSWLFSRSSLSPAASTTEVAPRLFVASPPMKLTPSSSVRHAILIRRGHTRIQSSGASLGCFLPFPPAAEIEAKSLKADISKAIGDVIDKLVAPAPPAIKPAPGLVKPVAGPVKPGLKPGAGPKPAPVPVVNSVKKP